MARTLNRLESETSLIRQRVIGPYVLLAAALLTVQTMSAQATGPAVCTTTSEGSHVISQECSDGTTQIVTSASGAGADSASLTVQSERAAGGCRATGDADRRSLVTISECKTLEPLTAATVQDQTPQGGPTKMLGG